MRPLEVWALLAWHITWRRMDPQLLRAAGSVAKEHYERSRTHGPPARWLS